MKCLGIIGFIFMGPLSYGQISDPVANAIKALLLEKEVSEKIFFYYEDDWRGPGLLPPGTYAFICPDTTYQKVHHRILDEFPYSLGVNDGYLYKIKFYKDSVRSIYINGTLDYTLYIVFKRIFITPETANVVFFTTSLRDEERFKNRYILVNANLSNKVGEWKAEKCKIKTIEWTEYFHRKFIGR